MTDEQIETAFNEAQERWNKQHPYEAINHAAARYFFFAGSEFGLASAKEIYSETFQQAAQ